VNGGFILYGLWSVGGVGIVENGAARHTHDTSSAQIASGSALVCGFAYALRIRAYGLGFGRLVYTFGKAFQIQECARVSGSCSVRESREKSREKRKHCKASVKGLEARRWEKCLFSF